MAELIKGALVASHIRHQVAKDVVALATEGVRPCLAVLIAGEDPASQIYVKRKQQACAAVGIKSVRTDLPGTATTADVLGVIREWNADPAIHGILVQLPLPAHAARAAILDEIDPDKDVDGVSGASLGHLLHGVPKFLPCTPAAVLELLQQYDVGIRGKHVVIVNRGLIVGVPLAIMLASDSERGNATVTLCHEHTQAIEQICASADILISAVGKLQDFRVRGDMVKNGAIVIDVGINRSGRRVVGDVDFDEVAPKASLITPVPGGVGPCTIAMLLKNTMQAARASIAGWP